MEYIYNAPDCSWQSLDVTYDPNNEELSISAWHDGCDAYGSSVSLNRDEAFELYKSLRDFFESGGTPNA